MQSNIGFALNSFALQSYLHVSINGSMETTR
jgi:hypothetical protein